MILRIILLLISIGGVVTPAGAQWYGTVGASVAFSRDSRVDRPVAPGAGIGIGYRWDVMRVEFEAGAPSLSSRAQIGGLFGAVYAEPWRFGDITPYGVAGVGWAMFGGSDAFTGHGRTMPVYFAGVGVDLKVNSQWSVAADVRRYVSESERYRRINNGLTAFRVNTIGIRLRYQFDAP